jgi:hypothetical protein
MTGCLYIEAHVNAYFLFSGSSTFYMLANIVGDPWDIELKKEAECEDVAWVSISANKVSLSCSSDQGLCMHHDFR